MTGPLKSPLKRSDTFIHDRATRSWWRKETTPCANQPKGLDDVLKFKKVRSFAIFFNCIASTMAFFHLWFGTLLFSSLVFVAVYDIMNSIFWRYLLSTAICRLVLLIELAGLREPGLKEVDELAAKVSRLEKTVTGIGRRVDGEGTVGPVARRTGPGTDGKAYIVAEDIEMDDFELSRRALGAPDRSGYKSIRTSDV